MSTTTRCLPPAETDEAIQMIGPDDVICPGTNTGDHCNCFYDDGDDGHADEGNWPGQCCYCEIGEAVSDGR